MARRRSNRVSSSISTPRQVRRTDMQSPVATGGTPGTPMPSNQAQPIRPFRPQSSQGIPLQGPEERLLASDLASLQVASNTETEVAMYASENGVCDLNRLYVQLSAQSGDADLDAIPNVTMGSNLSQILIRDSEKLVFNGRVPAGAFDGDYGYTGWRQYGEPTVALSSGDTVKVSVEQTTGANANFGFGAAFRPNSINGRTVRVPWGRNSYNCWIGSDETTLADGSATTMTATVTQAGWLVLSDIVLNAYLGSTSGDTRFDMTSRCYVTSYQTDAFASTALVLSGSGKTAAAPSSFFSSQRKHRLVRWPIVRADSGNTISLTCHVEAGNALTGQFSVPFIPLSQQLNPPCPPVSC